MRVSRFAPILAMLPWLVMMACALVFQPATGWAQTADMSQEKRGTVEGDDLEQLEDRADESLESLFAALKRQSDPAAARRIASRIWQEWSRSGSASIDLLMDRAATAVGARNAGVALDLLDQITTLAPDYAEGWNRQATLYYNLKDYGRSLGAIERVLSLEPRHFGALSGLAIIMESLDRDRTALETWYRVLKIYPANEAAQSRVIKLEEKLSGRPT